MKKYIGILILFVFVLSGCAGSEDIVDVTKYNDKLYLNSRLQVQEIDNYITEDKNVRYIITLNYDNNNSIVLRVVNEYDKQGAVTYIESGKSGKRFDINGDCSNLDFSMADYKNLYIMHGNETLACVDIFELEEIAEFENMVVLPLLDNITNVVISDNGQDGVILSSPVSEKIIEELSKLQDSMFFDSGEAGKRNFMKVYTLYCVTEDCINTYDILDSDGMVVNGAYYKFSTDNIKNILSKCKK